MQIGLLVTNLRELEESTDWDFDYLEGFPGLLGIDADDPQTEREFSALLEKHPLQMKTMCGFIPDPQGRGLMVVGPDVSLDRLRTFVTRVFDLMQRTGVEVIGYGSGGSRWVPDGFDHDKARQQVADFMHLCADLGEPRGVKVALEPYNRDDANLLNTVSEATEFIADVNRSHAKLMADFFHMKLNGESFDALKEAGPHLIHAHIAEPGRGPTANHASRPRAFPTHIARIRLRRARNAERRPAGLCRRRRDRGRPQKSHRVKVPSFAYSRMVDLSRTIVPSEGRLIHYRTARVPVDDPPTDRWYITTSIEMGGHAGTHVEGPLHAVQDGPAIADLDVERFFGEAIVFDFSDAPLGEPLSPEQFQRAAEPGGGVRPGDIALFRFDWDQRATAGSYPPYPTTAALRWLVKAGVKLLGIDTPGLDIPGDRSLPNHHLLFAHGIPLIESLDRLGDLRQPRVYLFAQPLPAAETDAIPLRVLAFEG